MTQKSLKLKFDRLWALKEEIEFAESQLKPHDTGHINTAISWMTFRMNTIKAEMEFCLEELDREDEVPTQ